MQCPVCQNTQLVMSERQGIEIDYCPQCRGVWLDRGELDKLIDRAAPASSASPAQPLAPSHAPQQPARHPDDRRRDEYNGGYYRKKKREGLLSQIFDFD